MILQLNTPVNFAKYKLKLALLCTTGLLLGITNGYVKTAPPAYPRVADYFSVVQPISTWNKDGFTNSFSGAYSIGFPFGLNLLKSDSFGISFEVTPTIRTEKNISKVSSVLFHPGAMIRFSKGFTFLGRVAFETNGRFGFTPYLTNH